MKRLVWLLVLFVLAGMAAPAPGAAAQGAADHSEVIIAIDTSGSMRPAIEAAKAAADEFVASMPADVRIGVETFADEVTVLTPPTTDRALLGAQIASITADGDTALYDVVVAARQRFTPAAEHKVLVLLSDGKDEGSTSTLEEAMAAVEGLHVEAISLTTAETDLASLSALGAVTSAEDAAGVSAAFARVAGLVVEVLEPVTVPATTTTAPPTTVVPAAVPPPVVTAVPSEVVIASPQASSSSSRLWLGAVGIFAGLFLLGMLLFPRARVSKARLGIETPRRASDIGIRATSAIDDALVRHGKRGDLGTALAVAFFGGVILAALLRR
jgi:tight adherence protein B